MRIGSRTRSVALLAGVIALLAAGCSSSDEEGDAAHAEIDAIIDEWSAAWLASDGQRVAALYEPVHGVYADAAVGGEIEGAEGIARMVGDLTFWIDFTGSEAISVDYTDNGAVVQWVWEGMVVTGADYGEHFSMRAQTTFEIEDGLITRSTDDYVLTDAPWG